MSGSADQQGPPDSGPGAIVPIGQHALLSDQRTAAIVTPDARVVWLCSPRVDASPFLAELLGGPAAGFFAVRPLEAAGDPVQRYVDRSMVLETAWGGVSVLDYLDCSEGLPAEPARRSRLVRVLSGTGKAVVEFTPHFGRISGALLEQKDDDVVVFAGVKLRGERPNRLWLRNGIRLRASPGPEWHIESHGRDDIARTEVDLSAGPVVLELLCGNGADEYESSEPERRSATTAHWRDFLDDYVALAGPTGLMSEEHDPVTGQARGNFPQAYSHLGLIENALNLAERSPAE